VLVIKLNEKIDAGPFVLYPVLSHSFNSPHIRNKLEFKTFPVDKPTKLLDPFFSLNGAGGLQDFDILFCLVDLVNLLDITLWFIVNPQNDVLLERNWRRQLYKIYIIVVILTLYFFDQERSKWTEHDFIGFRIK